MSSYSELLKEFPSKQTDCLGIPVFQISEIGSIYIYIYRTDVTQHKYFEIQIAVILNLSPEGVIVINAFPPFFEP